MSKIYKDIKDEKIIISLNESEVLTIVISSNIEIDYEFNNGDYKVLVFNNSESDLSLIENGFINNSTVEINYLELNNNKLTHNNNIVVNKGSSLTINSTYLGANEKMINFNLINKERDSIVNISNNVVCLENADFVLNVIGKIVKGAKNSKCFQKSRCLTFENPKVAKVLPILEIDENDVEASHSLSSGTIDEDVLFYMNSRGLSKKEALGLLLVSYLMPNEDFYKEYEEGLLIKEIADRKVEKICSM